MVRLVLSSFFLSSSESWRTCWELFFKALRAFPASFLFLRQVLHHGGSSGNITGLRAFLASFRFLSVLHHGGPAEKTGFESFSGKRGYYLGVKFRVIGWVRTDTGVVNMNLIKGLVL